MTLLFKLKVLLGITDSTKDALLTLILEQATDDYLTMTHQTDAVGADTLILRMAVVRYNLIGCEGMGSQNFNGLSESFEGYGDDIISAIRARRRAKVI
ncbi:MAG: phage head-tail connector protein [Paludibacteraceae bacterium]|nr:phage head-tail connector protein [Paludibacteraceae bacterium]